MGVPCVADRALQRSAAQVLSAIYEQDFLSCSFGGRPGRGAHQALASLHEVISGRKVEWVLEADLKNFFGSLSHEWMLRFVEHRIGDPRLINLIRRWLKASVLEDGEVHANEEGTPQGSSISVMLSNVYLHYALDLWFERVVKPRLRGEAYLVRYIDDFVLCFQYRADALRVQKALCQRQSCISLTRSCKLSPRCEATSDERSAGNLHATFCGSRGAGDRPRPPGGHRATGVPTAIISYASWPSHRRRLHSKPLEASDKGKKKKPSFHWGPLARVDPPMTFRRDAGVVAKQ